jgi:hypothetical protein
MTYQYKTITDYGTDNGAMPLLYSIRDGVPGSFEVVLFMIFLILFAGQYFLVTTRTGRQKILVALLSSSFVMIPLSILLMLTQLVNFMTVFLYAFICIVVFIFFVISDNS